MVINACTMAPQELEFITAWDAEAKSSQGDGGHGYAQSIHGNLVCDPALDYAGSQLARHFPGPRGIKFHTNHPNAASLLNPIQVGWNAGVFKAKGLRDVTPDNIPKRAILSLPGQGVDGDLLIAIQRNAPSTWKDVLTRAKKHSDLFVAERQKINADADKHASTDSKPTSPVRRTARKR